MNFVRGALLEQLSAMVILRKFILHFIIYNGGFRVALHFRLNCLAWQVAEITNYFIYSYLQEEMHQNPCLQFLHGDPLVL